MSRSTTTNSNQTTNGTSSLTQTPTNPSWVDQGLSGLGAAATNLAAQDPYSFVAPANSNITGAAATAAGLAPNNGQYAGSTDLATSVGQASAPDIASLMNSFKNPWQKQVVDSTLAGFDQNAGYSRAADALAKAGDSTFGGSGGAIQTALNEQNIANQRSQLQSGLETQGFNTALQGATSQAQDIQNQYALRNAAAGQITNNANSQTSAANADATTNANIGAILQQLQQARTGAPINSLGSISSIFDGLPLNLEHGTNANGTTNSNTTGSSTTTSSDPLGSLGSLAMGLGALGFAPFTGGLSLGGLGGIGASMAGGGGGILGGSTFSDRRLKTDIKRVGETDDGLGVFTYRYKAGGPKQMGVMAQDVQRKNPSAVRDIGGLLAVDYSKVA